MEYWEHVWSAEDPGRISALQDAWARSCGEMIELFRSNGVETVCDAACGFGACTLAMAAGGCSFVPAAGRSAGNFSWV